MVVDWVARFPVWDAAARFGGVVSFAMLASGTAHAEPYVEGRLGAGVASGHYDFEQGYTTEEGFSAIAHDEGGPLGIAFELGASGGFAFDERWAVGVGARIQLAHYLEEIRPRHSSVTSHLLAGIGPVFAWRPSPTFELALAPEWVFLSFAGSTNDIGSADNIFEFDGMSGPGCGFSLGQRWRSGFGLGLQLNVAALSSDHQTYFPMTTLLTTSWSTF